VRIAAFTLIELLVVITIIVVLLALLTPALDQAVYQAELAACGARVKGLAGGVLLYAFEYKKRYPTPKGDVRRSHTVLTQWDVDDPANPNWDLRPLLQGYVSINGHLNDPLCLEVDYEGAKQDGSTPFTGNFAAYSILWDWRYVGYGAGEHGMSKIGDRFSWTQPDGMVRRYSVLAADFIEDSVADSFTIGSHPDSLGLMVAARVQDASPPWWGAPAGQNTTVSFWWRPDSDERGLIDRNFAHDDGSVRRVDGQPWGDGVARGPGDDRMAVAPVFNNGRTDEWDKGRKIYLPKE
jgi:prepilin-type N-terminal cleavage/methylation domain-containing protein